MKMIRIMTQVSESQLNRLKKLAVKKNTSVAGVIRQAVEKYIHSDTTVSEEELRKRALEVVGCFNSGLSDLGVAHDKYLEEGYK